MGLATFFDGSKQLFICESAYLVIANALLRAEIKQVAEQKRVVERSVASPYFPR